MERQLGWRCVWAKPAAEGTEFSTASGPQTQGRSMVSSYNFYIISPGTVSWGPALQPLAAVKGHLKLPLIQMAGDVHSSQDAILGQVRPDILQGHWQWVETVCLRKTSVPFPHRSITSISGYWAGMLRSSPGEAAGTLTDLVYPSFSAGRPCVVALGKSSSRTQPHYFTSLHRIKL
jgi:hypothetical protein